MTAASRTEPGRIVVGVDGSPASIAALQWARRIAASTGSGIQALTVWSYPSDCGAPGPLDGYRPDLDAAKCLATALDEAFPGHRPAAVEPLVRQGHVRPVLLAAAEGAEMLIVGSRGHGGFAGLLLGAVSATCAEHAHCPVLVVHARQS